jgi:hypothetical protein
MRQVAKALDRPLELVPARWTAVRIPVGRLHHGSLDMTGKTLANHEANVRAALRWIAGGVGLPSRGAPLTPEWSRQRDRIDDKGLRARLYGLMRYASARKVMPTGRSGPLLEARPRTRLQQRARPSPTPPQAAICAGRTSATRNVCISPSSSRIET